MSKKNGNGRWLAGTLLAIALGACGTIQGASQAGAGIPSNVASGDNHLTEFDANDTAGYVGWCDATCHSANAARDATLGGDSAGSTTSAPALVP
jgi:hypothetical protein